MSDEKLTTPTATDNDLFLWINWYENSKLCLIFKRSCLNKKNATYAPPNRIKFFIVYEWDEWSRDLNFDFTLKNSLFGGVKLAKNADRDKSVYIFVMVLGLMHVQNFYLKMQVWEKMSLLLELIWPHLYILLIRKNIS